MLAGKRWQKGVLQPGLILCILLLLLLPLLSARQEVSGGKNMKQKFSLPSLSGSVTETFSYIDFGITKHREISDT